MNIAHSARYTSFVCVAVVLLAGCGDGGSQPSPLNPTVPDVRQPGISSFALLSRTATSVRPMTPHPDRSASWVSPDLGTAGTTQVLFVSDYTKGDVYLYSLPGLSHKGTLTGYSQPQGMCSDNEGHVWVTNTGTKTILELSHRGVLLNTLNDSSGFPVGCAWDAITGNLAVTNIIDGSSTPGAILIYAHAKGTPAVYRNPKQYSYFFAGYDTKGNLFVDGAYSGKFVLSELHKNATKVHTVEIIGGTINDPGMVEWYAAGNYLIVGDQQCGGSSVSCLYKVVIANSGGTITGTIKKGVTKPKSYSGGPICDLTQGTEFGTQLAGSDAAPSACGSDAAATYVWPFPAAHNPTVYNSKVDSAPIGVALSVDSK